jgi:hypothetical protein
MASSGATRGSKPSALTRAAVADAPGSARVIQTVRALGKVELVVGPGEGGLAEDVAGDAMTAI